MVRLTDRLDMTIAVDWDITLQIKQTNKQKKKNNKKKKTSNRVDGKVG